MKKLFIFFTFISQVAFASEPLIDSANTAYSKNQFEKAAVHYETVLSKGYESAELYYNLGNAYFKSNKLGLAITNYERAKRLLPNDEDIRFNLKMANQKLVDKVDAVPQLFIKEWFLGFMNIFTEKGWSVLCIILFIASLAAFAVYFLSGSIGAKKTGFWSGLVLMLFFGTTFFIAMKSYSASQNHNEAIVIVQTLNVKSSPADEGTNLFILHEGTKATINQKNGDWAEIKIPNGNTGWVRITDLAVI